MSISIDPTDYVCAVCGVRMEAEDIDTPATMHARIQPGTFGIIETCPGSHKQVVPMTGSEDITAVLWRAHDTLHAVSNAANAFTAKLAAQASDDLMSKWRTIMGPVVYEATRMWSRLADWRHYQTRSGLDLVALERVRQVVRGHNQPQDAAEHRHGELVRAAICYAVEPQTLGFADVYWPWAEERYKPTPGDRIHELTVAAALLVAEIDRLHYLEQVGDVDTTTKPRPQGRERN